MASCGLGMRSFYWCLPLAWLSSEPKVASRHWAYICILLRFMRQPAGCPLPAADWGRSSARSSGATWSPQDWDGADYSCWRLFLPCWRRLPWRRSPCTDKEMASLDELSGQRGAARYLATYL